MNHISGSTGDTQIPVGHHTYSFQFQLPKKLPSSFIGSHGEISYSVKAVIDRPWRFDHKTVKFFNVVGVLDLNKDGGGWVGVLKPLLFSLIPCCPEFPKCLQREDVWLPVLRIRPSFSHCTAAQVRVCAWGEYHARGRGG